MNEELIQKVYSYPFLSRLKLRNFKSVGDQEVSLAPLTLIVGENSSGKSSILQAIRLMQQAACMGKLGEVFPLNGNMISMDNFEELRSVQAKKREKVSIGFDLTIPTDYFSGFLNDITSEEYKDYWFIDLWIKDSATKTLIISWQVYLGEVIPDESGSALVKGLHFSLANIHGKGCTLDIPLLGKSNERDAQYIDIQPVYGKIDFMPYLFYKNGNYGTLDETKYNDLSLHKTSQSLDKNGSIQICFMNLKGGALPKNMLLKQDTSYVIAFELIAELIAVESTLPKKKILARKEREELVRFAAQNVQNRTERQKINFKFNKALYDIEELINIVGKLSKYDNLNKYESLVATIAECINIEGQTYFDWKGGDNNFLIGGANYLSKLCDANIKYLGPLREPPNKIMPTWPIGQTGDIGRSGEFTASVLHRFGREQILAPMPDGASSKWVPLVEAVQVWAHHLELIQSLKVVQEARFGHTIKVELEGMDKEVPLPAVGVGVSQLLPVLVLCLLSKPGSMILLEQPELHLHPALQQRLADFLIAVARSGRQLIVETHSEYIVSRLRRRIAEDTSDEDDLLAMSKIVFAERDRQTGLTTYREVEFSPYGAIEEWPKGFFDQASEEEREIIRSGFKKLAARDY